MKKLIALLITIATALSLFTACAPDNDTEIKIGVMNGPTGMGMAKLINDETESEASLYTFESFSSPADAQPKLLKGELDMLCLPTNTAAALATKLDVSVIAINCLGSLYLMTDADTTIDKIADLDGKTVYCSVPTSTTQPILNYIFKEAGINVKVECVSDHDALVAKIAKNEVSIAVLPEPKASAATAKNNSYSVDLNISEEWSKLSDEPLTMGCIVVRNEFLKNNKRAVNTFLDKYAASIEYINAPENIDAAVEMITNAKIIPAAPIARKALNNLYGSIVYLDGREMKNALISFYNAIGQDLPDESFYYVKWF